MLFPSWQPKEVTSLLPESTDLEERRGLLANTMLPRNLAYIVVTTVLSQGVFPSSALSSLDECCTMSYRMLEVFTPQVQKT